MGWRYGFIPHAAAPAPRRKRECVPRTRSALGPGPADGLAARGRTSTSDRWEYRYNAHGEVASAWKQFTASVTTPAAGEIQAATGSLYAYDDSVNRTQVQEASRAALSTATTPHQY